MRYPEKHTTLTDALVKLHRDLEKGPAFGRDSKLALHLIERVEKSRAEMTPWIPKKLCQYPMQPKLDDFNLQSGLGKASLQGAVDALNNFKLNCLKAIKTKLEAIGPEAAKDSKLAAGAANVAKEILEAAKCFTKIVQNVNNLVDSYISAIDTATSDVINQINILEKEIAAIIISIRNFYPELVETSIGASLTALSSVTDIFTILATIDEIEKEYYKASNEIEYLKGTSDRIKYHLKADLHMLKSRVMALKYNSQIRDMLKSSRESAKNSYMKDDFLDDVNTEIEDYAALSFDWSITNTAFFNHCSAYDSDDTIIKLNSYCKTYTANGWIGTNSDANNEIVSSLSSLPITIASHKGAGHIIIPDDGMIVSAGIGRKAGPEVRLILELLIDDCSTIIQAMATGLKPPEGQVAVIARPTLITNSAREINYTTCVKLGVDKYRLTLAENTEPPRINSLYKFTYTGSDQDMAYYAEYGHKYVVNETTGAKTLHKKVTKIPIPFKVIEATHNTVTLKRYSKSEIEKAGYFIAKENWGVHENGSIRPPEIVMLDVYDLPSASDDVYIPSGELHFKNGSALGRAYIIATKNDNGTYSPIAETYDSKDGKIKDIFLYHKTTLDPIIRNAFEDSYGCNPKVWNAYVSSITDVNNPHYNKYIYTVNGMTVISLKQHELNGQTISLHAGQKIPVSTGFILNAYLLGDVSRIRKIRFSREDTIDEVIVPFFLKAKWGFIPKKEEKIQHYAPPANPPAWFDRLRNRSQALNERT